MKILFLGDYSGFYKNLKEGLIELGHDVDISSTGDGYKKTIDSDLYIPSSKSKLIRMFQKLLFLCFKINEYYGYDVVQIIDHNVFGGLTYNYNYYLVNKIKKNSNKMFLSSCGTSYFVYKSKDLLEYNYVDDNIIIDLKGVNKYIKKSFVNNNVKVAELVDGIIPTMYTYKVAYHDNPNLLDTIPFPINVNSVKFIPQKIENERLKIFHGITREGFKGSKYIREAMKKIKKQYPNDVEIIIDGNMSLKDYLKVLESTNVVIDQALSYEYGMNAVYSMAMGKVVLSGNEPESQKEFGRTDIPIINIKPSVEDIYNQLEKLVLNKTSVVEIGKQSRIFVEDFHDHVKVAQQYIDAWNSVEVGKNEKFPN